MSIAFAPAFETTEPRIQLRVVPADQVSASRSARPAASSRRTAPASAVRLTRRGRLVLFLGALALLLGGGVFFGAGAVGTEQAGTPEPSTIVTVAPGETLWSIAAESSDGGDVRDVMTKIEELNALETPVLQAGQRLRVPTED